MNFQPSGFKIPKLYLLWLRYTLSLLIVVLGELLSIISVYSAMSSADLTAVEPESLDSFVPQEEMAVRKAEPNKNQRVRSEIIPDNPNPEYSRQETFTTPKQRFTSGGLKRSIPLTVRQTPVKKTKMVDSLEVVESRSNQKPLTPPSTIRKFSQKTTSPSQKETPKKTQVKSRKPYQVRSLTPAFPHTTLKADLTETKSIEETKTTTGIKPSLETQETALKPTTPPQTIIQPETQTTPILASGEPMSDPVLISPPPISEIKQVPDQNYIVPRSTLQDNQVNPFTTTFPLNSLTANHQTDWQAITANYLTSQRHNFDFIGLYKLDSKLTQGIRSNNVYELEHRGEYLSLATLLTDHTVTVKRSSPVTATAMEMQLSFTGNCDAVAVSAPPGYNCSFTPALISDPQDINPASGFPKRFIQVGNVGDLLSPNDQKTIQQRGFQNRLEDGRYIGLDLFFPNIESTGGNSVSTDTSIKRTESFGNTPAIGFYQVHQKYQINSETSVFTRTIRGVGIRFGDDDLGLTSTAQIIGQLIPDVDVPLEGTDQAAKYNASNNLIRSANQARLPLDSLTLYNGGASVADAQLSDKPQNTAYYQGVWLGLSPVTEYNLTVDNFGESVGRCNLTSSNSSQSEFLKALGNCSILTQGGGEGGVQDRTPVTARVNDFLIDTQNVADFYTQVYLTFFHHDLNDFRISKLEEKTSYVPHLSYTGNITKNDNVWRYYAGIIPFSKTGTKAYVGTDYTYNKKGWNLFGSMIGYLNPSRDYYSELALGVSKTMSVSKAVNLSLFSNFNYAFDRNNQVGIFAVEDTVSSLNIGTSLNHLYGSIGAIYVVDTGLDQAAKPSLTLTGAVALGKSIRFSGYYVPVGDRSNVGTYGMTLQANLSKGQVNTALTINYAKKRYDFGDDYQGKAISTDEDLFTVILRMEGL